VYVVFHLYAFTTFDLPVALCAFDGHLHSAPLLHLDVPAGCCCRLVIDGKDNQERATPITRNSSIRYIGDKLARAI
jgi:hypothetical protein